MAARQEEFELVLGNKQILSIFFLMVVLFAVFFSFGYSVGYNRGQEVQEQAVATVEPMEEDDIRVPDTLLKDAPPLPEEPVPARPEATPRKQQAAAGSESGTAKAPKPRPFPEKKASPPPPARKKAPEPREVTGAAVARSMHLQVAALRVRSDAAMLADKLKAKGYPAVLFDQSGDGWHRVLVGPFRSETAAKEFARKLKGDGFDTILRKP